MKRIGLILGRGIEGAGVTRYSLELNNWLNKNGYNSKIFSLTDKLWMRRKGQERKSKIIEIDNNEIKDMSRLINNNFDFVFYVSIPSKKNSYKCIQDFYNYLVKGITIPKKIGMQHDHKKQSLNRNANLYEIFSEMDFIVSHSKDNVFYEDFIQLNGDKVLDKFIQLERGVDLNLFENKFRNNDYKNRRRGIIYLGRFATFKDPYRLIKFHNEFLHNKKIFTELIGIERSLASLYKIYKFEDSKTDRHMIEIYDSSMPQKDYFVKREKQKQTVLPYVYRYYNREEILKQITNNLFGCSFYDIPEMIKFSALDIEYTQIEMIASGLIPLFDFNWAVRNNIEMNEKIGIFLKKDLSNAEECLEEIERIFKINKLRKEYLNNSYELIKQNNDSDIVFKRMIKKIGIQK